MSAIQFNPANAWHRVCLVSRLALFCVVGWSLNGLLQADDLSVLSLEDLLQMPVRSAAKKKQPLLEATTAITILDSEFLENSPFSQLPDFLRYVPGMSVARGNASISAVTARGFNNRYANKLLVLSDGRSIYSSAYSGVFWEAHPFFLNDLDTIEVIRGPGGTLWGANAVNGVINITTKPSWETQGWMASTTSGTNTDYSAGLRYGGATGKRFSYRISGLAESFQGGDFAPRPGFDAWKTCSARARIDYEARSDRFLTIHAQASRVVAGESVQLTGLSDLTPARSYGETIHQSQSLLAKWEQLGDEESLGYHAQVALEHTVFDSYIGHEKRSAFEVELLGRRRFGAHEVSLGTGVRFAADQWGRDRALHLEDYERPAHIAHALIQDEIRLADWCTFTAGGKLEHHGWDIGWAFQPNLRAMFRLSETQRLWVAVSRAARTPSRGELGLAPTELSAFPVPPIPGMPLPDRMSVVFSGNPEVHPEYLNAFEVGYRVGRETRWSFEVTGFLHRYTDLIGATLAEPKIRPEPLPHFETDLSIENRLDGRSHGVEASFRWLVSPRFDWTLNYAFLEVSQWAKPGYEQSGTALAVGASELVGIGFKPSKHAVSLVAQWQPTDSVDTFLGLRWGSATSGVSDDWNNGLEADLALHFNLSEQLRCSLNGRHMLRASRTEYAFSLSELATQTELERAIDARLEWSF